VYVDRDLIEKRIQRELWERVLPLVHPDRRPLTVSAGPDPDHLEPFTIGSAWGAPWGTTWFELCGTRPESWAGKRVEAVIDLGFHPNAAGFQCEGLLVERDTDGRCKALQGIHPRRTNHVLDDSSGDVRLLLEAASNPAFPQFRPSPLGSLQTAGEAPIYRFRRAELVVVDPAAEALAYDLEVLDGVMRTIRLDDPRRVKLLRAIESALDRLPDFAAASRVVRPLLLADAGVELPDRHRAVAIGHAHIDTAWLWPIRETRRKCIRTFASAVALMDDYPEYHFAVSSAQHYAWIEESQPELFGKIVERVERGQWVPVGGMWVEADMNLPSGESLVRQVVFGQRYFEEKFGERCEEVWIPDVFGYPAGLPQVFAAGGMTRFVTQKLSWNKQNKFPHSTFWWEGLDGTRVLTHFPPVDTYNAEITPAEVAFSARNFRDHGWSSQSLMPFGHGDGGGGPTREMLERARRLATVDPNLSLDVGTPDIFFDRVEAEIAAGAPAPVWRGELYFETHRGTLTSQLRTKLGNRRCERLLVEAELWAATLGRAAGVDDLWREVLTQQFHDILPGSSISWVHADAEAVFDRVSAELETRIDALLTEIASPGLTDSPTTWLANRADTPIDGVIIVDLPDGRRDTPVAGGQVLSDGRFAVAVRVPALGMVRLTPQDIDDRVVMSDTSMTNSQLAVRWDRAGNITSIIDLVAARELVPTGSYAAVLELAPDHPVEYDAWDLESWTRNHATALTSHADPAAAVQVLDAGPLVGRVAVHRRFGPSTSTVTYELRAGSRELFVDVDLDWHHDEHLLSMAFPIDVRTDSALCDVQFGVVSRPTHPSNPWDAAKFEVCAHRFVDLAEPDFGVAVLNDGRYGHSVFDGAIRVSLARAAKYPDPGADHGRHRVTLAIHPHDAGLSAVRDAAARLNAPLRAVAGSMRADDPRPVVRVSSSTGGVEIDAVKSADDGSGDLIVRLHEACGNRAAVVVHPHRRVAEAWFCNLLEEPGQGEEVGDGIASFTLRPFQLVTLRLRLAADHFDGRTLT
jgi:alpha-mannosidase